MEKQKTLIFALVFSTGKRKWNVINIDLYKY